MSSVRKSTGIPLCMRMSFNYPWESSPEKEINDPLSYDPSDVTPDFEAIYGEGAAKLFFQSTPAKEDNALLVLQDDSPYTDVFLDLFGPELTPELPSQTESPPASSSGNASDSSSLPSVSPGPSHKHGIPGGKQGRQTTISNARVLCLPYQRHLPDSAGGPGFPPSRSDYPMLPPGLASPSSSTTSSVSSNLEDVLTPEFMRSLQVRPLGIPMVGPSSLPGSRALAPHHQQPSKSSVKSQCPPSHSPQNVTPSAFRQIEAFAHQYCRYRDCGKRFPDKRTTERHRLTHLEFGTYVCPNPACKSRQKPRPHFASDFSLGRHFELAANDSPCAVGKGKKRSTFRPDLAKAEALIQQALVPFDPAIHTPF